MIERLVFIFLMCLGIRAIGTVQKINEIAGHKRIAAFLIGVDTILFLLVFKNLITGELTLPVVFSMALGYIGGYFLGTFIEEKMALGKVLVTIKISKRYSKDLFKVLNDNGFVFVRTKRVYTHKNKPKKIYQGIIYRKELPKLKSILKDFKILAYVEPIKTTFGQNIISSKEYLRNIEK
ncbi:MAG: hypothetical protein J7L08_02615 [Candidatus Aenigmarchaeota archaeon]|nr:hypothetical protein [Candidatus Aenigmarchaeota archaeon]